MYSRPYSSTESSCDPTIPQKVHATLQFHRGFIVSFPRRDPTGNATLQFLATTSEVDFPSILSCTVSRRNHGSTWLGDASGRPMTHSTRPDWVTLRTPTTNHMQNCNVGPALLPRSMQACNIYKSAIIRCPQS